MVAATHPGSMPRVRWSWLWGRRADVTWNLLPFWLAFIVVAVVYAARDLGALADNPVWNFTLKGRQVHLFAWVMYCYGPLVDAPHLWATVARTCTDPDEWAERRKLVLGSLLALVLGPVAILSTYALRSIGAVREGMETIGWVTWSNVFTFYALHHINRQHWGFVSLYKRKNGDMADAAENRADSLFFYTAIWLPYVAMLTAPWYADFDGKPFLGTGVRLLGTTTGALLHGACHALFVAVSAGYVLYQLRRWQRGVSRNGPKLLYLATIIPLNYLAFAIHPLLAALWVLITGTGHCAQYHRIVWAYGQSKYAAPARDEPRLSSRIFRNPWLYAALGVAFGLVTLQGPGAGVFKQAAAGVLQAGLFSATFGFLDASAGRDLGLKVAAALVSGVRLHHFYVDSKIWRVSKSKTLARNLDV